MAAKIRKDRHGSGEELSKTYRRGDLVRGLMRFLVFLALVGGGGLIALKMYLHSNAATSQIAARLQAALGVPVTVGAVELGGSNSAATDITIYEADAPTGSLPLVIIGRATTDIGVADFISGSTEPRKIGLSDVHLTLRYDRDGHLLTRLPAAHAPSKALPEFRLDRGSVTISKEGESDCTFCGMNAVVIEKDSRVSINGTINDSNWGGTWKATGSFPRKPGIGSMQLKIANVHVTQERLRRVPFVSEQVWQHVTLEGDTPVDLQLTLPSPPAPVSYRVTLSPTNTSVFIPSIDLTAAAAQGSVVVEDDLVMLRDVRGKVATGDLHVISADLDYRNPSTMMKFDLDGRRLNIRDLPAKWKLPHGLGGKLTGTAKLVVRIVDGVAVPTGTGDGYVDEATLGRIPIPNYGLHIKADRDGFNFQPRLGQ
jgi:hypothetical protein